MTGAPQFTTAAERRAFNLGVEAVRELARDRIDHWRTKMRKTGFLVDKWCVGARIVEEDATKLLLPVDSEDLGLREEQGC